MTNELVPAGFPFTPVYVTNTPWPQAVFRFANGYGASVINPPSGRVELAVAKFHGEGHNDWDFDYSTPVTNDVFGWIEGPEQLIELLTTISELPGANVIDSRRSIR